MNAQVAIVEKQDAAFERPEIRDLVSKQRKAEKSLPTFQAAQKEAQQKCQEAESKRTANTDPAQGPMLRQALVRAQGNLADADESLRVVLQNISTTRAQIDSAVSLFHSKEFKRVLEAYKLAKTESRKRRIEAERADIDLDRKYLAELSLHRSEYPPLVDHGIPQVHMGDGSDILHRRVIADCAIGENRTFFELLKVQ